MCDFLRGANYFFVAKLGILSLFSILWLTVERRLLGLRLSCG